MSSCCSTQLVYLYLQIKTYFFREVTTLALRVYPKTKELIRIIVSRFFKTSYHGEDIIDEDITDDADNYLPLDEVFICFSTRQKLRDIDEKHYNTVSEPAAAFYRESLRYVLDRMNMSCSFWRQAVLIDFFK